jgi:hypothetical protein
MFRANDERILRGRLAVMQELWDPEQGVNAHRASKYSAGPFAGGAASRFF